MGRPSKALAALLAETAARVEAEEKARGWNRLLGYAQLGDADRATFYEFGRFAQLVDLLEELEGLL